jgi:hypothetical protein
MGGIGFEPVTLSLSSLPTTSPGQDEGRHRAELSDLQRHGDDSSRQLWTRLADIALTLRSSGSGNNRTRRTWEELTPCPCWADSQRAAQRSRGMVSTPLSSLCFGSRASPPPSFSQTSSRWSVCPLAPAWGVLPVRGCGASPAPDGVCPTRNQIDSRSAFAAACRRSLTSDSSRAARSMRSC